MKATYRKLFVNEACRDFPLAAHPLEFVRPQSSTRQERERRLSAILRKRLVVTFETLRAFGHSGADVGRLTVAIRKRVRGKPLPIQVNEDLGTLAMLGLAEGLSYDGHEITWVASVD